MDGPSTGYPGSDGGGVRADAAAPGGADRRAEGRVGRGVEGKGHEHHDNGSVKARNEIYHDFTVLSKRGGPLELNHLRPYLHRR